MPRCVKPTGATPGPIHQQRRHGSALIFSLMMMSVMVVILALAIDGGRSYMAKGELQTAADNVARYAAEGLKTSPDAPPPLRMPQ